LRVIPIDLSGKVALVTGAARGIGAATAALLAQAGASVVLGDVLTGALEQTANEIAERGGKAKALVHDVTSEAAWEAVIAAAVEEFGGLDILVNNAGIEETVFLADIDAGAMRRLLDVNVGGVLFGHKYAIRAMRPGGSAGKGGSIINLSSVAGLIGHAGLSVYSASKGAVRIISKSAAVECGRLGYGIRVNSVHPGLVETAMAKKMLSDYVELGVFADEATAGGAFLAGHPIGRIGQPGDVASAILFLASDLASFVTGHELVVDGGLAIA
jgi:NAD(P)-dependent dehydrogenase (short-subunit alcohol dehydrogenase family)